MESGNSKDKTLARGALAGRSRWTRRLLVAFLCLLAVWMMGWLAVPPLVKWQLQKQASAQLGRTVTVDRVDFRPWTLELALEGLRVADSAGGVEQASVKRLYIDAELQSLLRLAPVVDALTVEQPRLVLRHLGDGRYDVDDVLQRLTRLPQEEPPGDPARFALFNIALTGGEVVFIDDRVAATHRVNDLVLKVPFLSNLSSQREVATEPQLAFVLNGSAFESRAASTPFSQTKETDLSLDIPALDLAPYLPYWPAQWSIQPEAGVLQLALKLAFEQRDVPQMSLTGQVALSGVRLAQRLPGTGKGDQSLLAFERLGVVLNRVEPLARRLDLASIEWQGPRLSITRDAAGQVNLVQLAKALTAPAASQKVNPSGAGASTVTQGSEPGDPWKIRVGRLALTQGTLEWRDSAVRPAAQLALEDLSWAARELHWPVQAPVWFEGAARLGTTPLTVQGSATDAMADAQLALGELPLGIAAPYWADLLEPALTGRIAANLMLHWQAATGDQPRSLVLRAPQMDLHDLTLGPSKRSLASLQRLRLEGLHLDLAARSIALDKLVLTRPQISVLREQDGHWMFERWLKPPSSPLGGQRAADQVTPAAPWKLALSDLALSAGEVVFEDRAPARPVGVKLTGLKLQLKNLQPLDSAQPAMPFSLQTRVASLQANQADPGQLALHGVLRLPAQDPRARDRGLFVRSQAQAQHLPLHALEPYFGDRLNLELLRADASYRGTLELALSGGNLALKLAGDAALDDFRANTLSPSEELLAWKSLDLRGVRLAIAPGEVTQVVVGETVLSDYFARVIVTESGRINLQGLLKETGSDTAAAATPTVDEPGGISGAPQLAASSGTGAAVGGPPPNIRFGPVSLVNGRVYFSDRFIQPNYSANLSELTGGLSAFSSASTTVGATPQLANLSLRGRAEGTAALEIDGKLNPLARPLALDIQGRVRDLELPPLSPYSVKYAGYGIERGKLSVDVAYLIQPDGQLSASNQIILNQLRFGDRVGGSEGPNLPVKLAVALLADRNGVIDINLPVSGSINDPQFRLGPIVFRLILNLIGKAITAPFSLLASAFGGGGDELSRVEFPAGRASLDDEARKRLDTLAKALTDRPALQLTVVGQSDLDVERSAYQRARLDDLVLAEKRRALAREGAAVPEALVVTPGEYPPLLKAVYQRADIPKPRNFVGMAKDIPQPEMEALLLASIPVSADTMRELAVARGMAVKDHLASRSLPESRMFLGAPRLTRQGDAWRPQVELKLVPG